ncbi:hypothetical protein NE237_004831 [Protea cynaroides]|uniref:Uncharacterized protein n=1 Tax=Protea cynaroides TaxID=273540 RepID=A0A9Q0KJL3_9MAGN|nr:hypothetical protein NE237_004831 [Protea cynaroides]
MNSIEKQSKPDLETGNSGGLPSAKLDSETEKSGGLPSENLILVLLCCPLFLLLWTIHQNTFEGRLKTFYAFMVADSFALYGPQIALRLRKIKPKFARFCISLSAASLATALAIFIWVSFLP